MSVVEETRSAVLPYLLYLLVMHGRVTILEFQQSLSGRSFHCTIMETRLIFPKFPRRRLD